MPSVNNTLIGALRAEATLEGGKFVDGARKIKVAAKDVESSVGGLKKSFSGLGSAMGVLKAGFAGLIGGLSVGLFANVVNNALRTTAALGDVSQQLGVTTKDLQTLRYAASQLGVSQSELDTGLTQLTATLGKVAAGAEKPARALAAIGITADELKGKDTGEAFRMIADGLGKVTDRSQRAAVEIALFGETGGKLDTMLSGGSGALNELANAAETLGIVLSDEQIQNADQTANRLDALQTVLQARIAGAVSDNADAILDLANSIANLVQEIVGALPQIRGFYHEIAAGFARSQAAAAQFVQTMANHPVNRFTPWGAALRSGNANREFTIRNSGAEAREQDWQAFLSRSGLGGIQSKPKPAVRPPAGDFDQFQAPKSRGGGRKPRAARAPRDRSDDVEYQFDQEERRANMDILRAKQDLAGTSAERSALALQILDLEKQGEDAELANRVRRAERDQAEGKITDATLEQVKAQAATLQAKNDEAFDLKRQAALREAELHRMERADDLSQRTYDYRLDDLKFSDELAQTASEHRRVQLDIVDVLYQQKEAHLRALKAQLEFAGKIEEAADVQAQLDRLPTDKARDQDRARRSTMGPWEQYASEIPNTADKMTEALEQVRVDGVEALTDSLLDAMTGVKSLGDAFSAVAKQIMADLLRIYIRKVLVGALGNVLGGIGGVVGSGAGTSYASSTALGGYDFSSVPGFAGGGSFRVFGPKGIDRIPLMAGGIHIANVSHGERINVANDDVNGGGATRVEVVPSRYFDVVVDGRVQRQVGPAMGQAAIAGATGGMVGMQRRASRQLP